jgi:subtilase family serine protease
LKNHRPQGTTVRILALVAVLVAVAAVVAGSTWSGHGAVTAVGMTPDTMRTPHIAQQVNPVSTGNSNVQFSCQTTPVSAGGPCYGPFQIRHAYGIDTLLATGNDGSGRTIVIIDAYGSTTLASDVALFNSTWSLPATNLTVLTPFGVDPTDIANAAGWSGETTLDVDWSHAVAPGAKIDLVVAKSNNDSDILDATQYAIDHNLGDVISQSFGEAEQCMASTDLTRQHALFARAVTKGITLFASSGDDGAAQPTCDGSDLMKAASTPASDPNVTSVGGTDLLADGTTGAYSSESTWNDDFGSGGGGVSVLYSRPIYQLLAAPHSSKREEPDVAYNASVLNGVLTPWTNPQPGPSFGLHVFRFGGTSAGSPQWAGIIAIVDQMAHHRVGNINPALYLLGSNPVTGRIFHDIADGSNNSVTDAEGNPIVGFTAVRGYDMATGLGSPNIGVLAPILAHSAPSAG